MSEHFNRNETESDRMEAAHYRRMKEIEDEDERKTEERSKIHKPSADRGFHHSDAMKAAEELRMEGKGSHDPVYDSSKKNK